MSEVTSARLSKAALAAFVLGVSSLVLSLAAALPALFLSVQAMRAIHRSEGRLRGQRLAIAGLTLSALVTVVTILGLISMVLLYVQEKSHVAGRSAWRSIITVIITIIIFLPELSLMLR